ncbi:MAG: protein kinase, partial [Pirellulales bacterium]
MPGYRVVSFLGRGGFGEVWKASAPGKTDAALKMIDLRGSQGAKEFDSLRLVKRIHHPNLIPVQAFWLKNADGDIMDEADAGWADATLAGSTQINPEAKPADSDGSTSLLTKPVELVIAMGLGQKSLFNRLREAQNEGHPGIPVDELLDYMECAAQGIEYLNASFQIVHGDIKPHNILVVGNAAAVCDFGLARAVENLRKTATTSVTVAYAAPEALRGR